MGYARQARKPLVFEALVRPLIVAMAQAGKVVPVLGPRVVAVRRDEWDRVYAEFK